MNEESKEQIKDWLDCELDRFASLAAKDGQTDEELYDHFVNWLFENN